MAVVGAEAFAVRGEPCADYLVFGAGEEDVTVFGVPVSNSQDFRFGRKCAVDE